MTECSPDVCGQPLVARGMCGRHYARWRRERKLAAQPLAVSPARARILRFEETGIAECKKHGAHTDWNYSLRKHPAGDYMGLRCRACNREAARAWAAASPLNNSYNSSLRGRLMARLLGARRRAEADGRDFDITIEWLLEQYERQQGRCAYTGWELELENTGRATARNPRGISLDRFDSSLGYTTDNCRIVCWAANRAKAERPMDEFVSMCKAVAATYSGSDTLP